jgi:hypothetical protein
MKTTGGVSKFQFDHPYINGDLLMLTGKKHDVKAETDISR